ncbi:MAG: ComEA family DNA-binding protein [Chloroflexi bacterium]|jgi:competence protein ComEA|nr:ComEA family DNA-binding protein [Chloroflexota bacterium]
MDRAAQPWHVLEEPEPDGTGQATTGGSPSGPAAPGREPDRPTGGQARHWALVSGGLAAAVILAGAALALTLPRPTEVALAGIETTGGTETGGAIAASAETAEPIAVDVGGAVAQPGVYRLAAGSRVADAIAAAGGYSPRVDVSAASEQLNLAAVLADGERVRVPARGEAPAPGGAGPGGTGTGGADSPAATADGGPLDLNRATTAELEALPGIGPVTAARIIAARESAPFTSVDDLRARDLVGAATFAKISALVAVGR